jgi:hypothetical protein
MAHWNQNVAALVDGPGRYGSEGRDFELEAAEN